MGHASVVDPRSESRIGQAHASSPTPRTPGLRVIGRPPGGNPLQGTARPSNLTPRRLAFRCSGREVTPWRASTPPWSNASAADRTPHRRLAGLDHDPLPGPRRGDPARVGDRAHPPGEDARGYEVVTDGESERTGSTSSLRRNGMILVTRGVWPRRDRQWDHCARGSNQAGCLCETRTLVSPRVPTSSDSRNTSNMLKCRKRARRWSGRPAW